MTSDALALTLVGVFALSGFLLAGLSYVVYRYRDARGTREFVVTLGLASLWSLSAAVKLIAPSSMEFVLVALEIVYGLVFVVTFFVFAAEYTGRDVHRRTWFGLGVGTAIGALLVLLATNQSHLLLWAAIEESTAVFPHLVHQGKGPAYWLVVGGSYCVAVVGMYFLLDLHLRSRYNTQSLLLIVLGVLAAFSANLVSLVDFLAIPGLDYTPFGLVLFGLATTIAIHQDLFAIVPIARDTAVEYSSEGMIICDTDRRVRDYNPTAGELFPSLASHHTEPVTDVIPAHVVRFSADEAHRGEIETTVEGETRYVAVRTAPITEGAHHLGWTVVLNDVTEQKRRERHLELVARVLRHNMSNEITIIQGQTEVLRVHLEEAQRDHLDTIVESGRRIVETSAKLRTIQDIVTDDQGPVPTNLGRHVETVVGRVEQAYPDADIAYDAPDVWVESTTGLASALENLLENAIEHNEAAAPWAAVDVTVDPDAATVAVADDGPGIPPNERRILYQGETPLKHSSGVGLWLVYRYVERAGRDLAFERREGGGSRVSFVLDRADAPEQ